MDPRGRVLLGKRGIEPFFGHWNMIGGFLDYGEDPLQGLRREVREELGVDCVIGDFVAAFSDTYGPDGVAVLNIYFRVHLSQTELTPRDDVTDLEWFPLDRIPVNMAFESDRKALHTVRGTGEEP